MVVDICNFIVVCLNFNRDKKGNSQESAPMQTDDPFSPVDFLRKSVCYERFNRIECIMIKPVCLKTPRLEQA